MESQIPNQNPNLNQDLYIREDIKVLQFFTSKYAVICKRCGKEIRADSLRRLMYALRMHYKRNHNGIEVKFFE